MSFGVSSERRRRACEGRVSLRLVLLAALVFAPRVAAAEPDAGERFRRGVALYRQERYGLALEEFEQAYALRPHPALSFNLAQAHYHLGHYALAVRLLRRYISTATGESPERRADVLEQLEDLKAKTAELWIVVDLPGSAIQIDGKSVGESPQREPIVVDAGSRTVTVVHSGYLTRVEHVDMRAGQARRVSLRLVPLPGPGSPLETAAWITTGGLGALAAASGIVTIAKHQGYEQARRSPQDREPTSVEQALREQRASVRSWALATDLLAAAALVSGGIALYARWQGKGTRGVEGASFEAALTAAGVQAIVQF